MAATTIARVSITDDDGTGQTGTIWNNAQLVAIYDDIDDLFKRTTAGDLTFELENTDTTSTSDTGFIARVGSGAAGDPYFQVTNGTTTWTWGLDNSDSDAWVLANSAALGNSNILKITASGFQGIVYINDTANANMTTGLTINQAGADNEIFTLKSSDVGHGVTSISETDSFMMIAKASATGGGVELWSIGGSTSSLILKGVAVTADATRSTAGVAPFMAQGYIGSGVNAVTVGADKNIAAFRDASTTRFILDSDGDSHQDVGTAWTNFDDGDDLVRLNAVAIALARKGDPLRSAFVAHIEDQRAVLDAMPGKKLVAFNADGHHFVNMSRLAMLHTGAIRQLGMRLTKTEKRLASAQRELRRLAA